MRTQSCLYDKMVRKSDIERRGIEHSRISVTLEILYNRRMHNCTTVVQTEKEPF